ncbi:MAG TPA: 30S ribosome-binding factor RbfA [Sphingobacteriaceae bacterium]|nr:30S ribosome-binding factor RbfA [Sphingobacteriaceae bacterium]
MSVRQERLAEAIKQELSEILRVMRDPRIGMASVVSVDVSRDLRHAKVYVSVFGDEDQRADTFAALSKARGFIRSELAKRLRIRYTPEIHFQLDDSIAHGARVAQLLRSLAEEQEDDGDEAGRGEKD